VWKNRERGFALFLAAANRFAAARNIVISGISG
jgi:hypothetical protein